MVGCQTYEARVMAEEGRKMLSYIMLGAVESLLVSDDRSITFFLGDYNACLCRFHILYHHFLSRSRLTLFENDLGGLGNEDPRADITLFYITADISIDASGCKDSFTN